jgi:hypothetical protein
VPEDKFASSEHELIQEITAPFAAVRADPEGDPGEADFAIVLRGYDRVAVDAYIRQARQVIEDLRATSSPEAAVRRALERVGEEISGILQRAHDTAEKITAQSRSEAEERLMSARAESEKLMAAAEAELEQARRDAVEIRASAEKQLTDLDAETDRIWAERHRIVEDTRDLSRQLVALTDSAAERFPPAEDTVTGATLPGLAGVEDLAAPKEPASEGPGPQGPAPQGPAPQGPAPHGPAPQEGADQQRPPEAESAERPYDHAAPADDEDTESTRVMPPPDY